MNTIDAVKNEELTPLCRDTMPLASQCLVNPSSTTFASSSTSSRQPRSSSASAESGSSSSAEDLASPHTPARLLSILHGLQVRAGPVQHRLLQLLLHPAPHHPHRAEQQPLGGVQGGPQVCSAGVPADSSLCAG